MSDIVTTARSCIKDCATMIVTFDFIDHLYHACFLIVADAEKNNKIIKSCKIDVDWIKDYLPDAIRTDSPDAIPETHNPADQYVVKVTAELEDVPKLKQYQRRANIKTMANIIMTWLTLSFKIKQPKDENGEPIIQLKKMRNKKWLYTTDLSQMRNCRIRSLLEEIVDAVNNAHYDKNTLSVTCPTCTRLFTDDTLADQLVKNTILPHEEELAIMKQILSKL